MSTNTFEGRIGSIELEGTAHGTSAVFVLGLRLVIGGMMLFAGLGKVLGEPFDASGFLVHGVDPASPVSGLYAAMAGSPVVLEAINVIVPVTQVLIGLALIAGVLVRLAAFGGAIQMLAFYLGGWEGEVLALFDSTLVYMIVFLAVAAFGAGRILGADATIEQWEAVRKRPWLRYLLG